MKINDFVEEIIENTLDKLSHKNHEIENKNSSVIIKDVINKDLIQVIENNLETQSKISLNSINTSEINYDKENDNIDQIQIEFQKDLNDEIENKPENIVLDISQSITEEFSKTIDRKIENNIIRDSNKPANLSYISQINDNSQIIDKEICNQLEEQILIDIEQKKEALEKGEINEKKHRQLMYDHCYDTDSSYSTTYSLIGDDKRIVVSLFCSQESLKFLSQSVENLYNQGFDCIYLIVDQNLLKLIPSELKLNCEIIVCKNSNPINKIYPVLIRENDPQTIIVSLENGIIYPNNLVKEIFKCFKRFPMSAHAISLMKFKSINFFENVCSNGNVGDLFESFYLVAYKRHFFKNDFKSYLDLLLIYDFCKYSDDLLIANYLYKYKIPIRCIKKKKLNKTLVKRLITKESIHTNSGLNHKLIIRYYKVIELLATKCLLYLRNSGCIREYFKYLINKPYNMAIRV